MFDVIWGVLIWWVVLGIDWYIELREGKYSKREIAILHIGSMVGMVLLSILIYYYPVRII